MADTEANTESNDSLVKRPQYMGEHRKEALEEDPKPSEDEVIDAELAAIDETLAPEEKTFKKRYGDLRRHSQGQVKSLEKALAEREAQLDAMQADKLKPIKTDEEVDAFAEQNPEAFDIIKTVSGQQVSSELADVKALKVELEKERASVRREKAAGIISDEHPDWDAIKESESFHEWAETQPEQIQAWIYNNPDNSQLASKAIDLFKLENGIKTQTKSQSRAQNQGSAADMVSTKTKTIDAREPKIWTEREIAAMSLDQFDKYEEEIRQALAEGRVVQ